MRDPASFQNFCRSFFVEWGTAMSGILSVPLSISTFFVPSDRGKLALALTALACFIYASYRVWRVQRLNVISLEAELEASPLRIREIEAQEANNEEMRLQREQREREIDPHHRVYNEARFEQLSKGDSVEDEILTTAARWLVLRSSWGRWQSAQSLPRGQTLHEFTMMQTAIAALQSGAEEGTIAILGWLPEKGVLELISIDTWKNKATLRLSADDRNQWRVSLDSKSSKDKTPDVIDYTYLMTDMKKIRELWPETDDALDAETDRLLNNVGQ
jgi:hypothetical protein